MKTKPAVTILILISSVLGCSVPIHFDVPETNVSVKKNKPPYPRKANNALTDDDVDAVDVVVDKTKAISTLVCPAFRLPRMKKPVELPYAELAKVNPRDVRALDKIEEDHIKALRADAIQIRNNINTAYNRYLADCRRYDAEHPGTE